MSHQFGSQTYPMNLLAMKPSTERFWGQTGHLYFPGAHQDYCRQKPTTGVDWIKVTSEGVEMGGQHTFQPQNVSVPRVCWCKQQLCSISHPVHALTHLSKMLEFMQWSHSPPSKAL